MLGLKIALAATCGDLFESAVKRDLGVKDSRQLLAGTEAFSTGSTRCCGPGPPRTSRCSRSCNGDVTHRQACFRR